MAATARTVTEQCDKAEEMPVRLAAFHDDQLSVEAAEQLVQMRKDDSLPTHSGNDLPTADRTAIMIKKKVQKQ